MLKISVTKTSPKKAGKYLTTKDFENFVLVDVLGEGEDTWFMSVFSDIDLSNCWWSVEQIRFEPKFSSDDED